MRASIFFAAPFAALALAQNTTTESTSSVSSIPYSNPFTSYLTETNSLGVVTGMPSVATSVGNVGTVITSQPAVATSQAAAALVGAGFTGVTTLVYGNVTAGNATSIIVSANSQTTLEIIQTPTSSSSPTGASGSASGSSGSKSSGSKSSGSGTATGSASTTSASAGAGAHVKVAGGALIGAAAFFAAFL